MPGEKQLQRLIEQARRRHPAQQISEPRNGRRRGRIDLEGQLRLETRRPQHAHGVLPETRLGIADQFQLVCGDIFLTADVVPERKVGDVVVERVAGEIPAPHVRVDRAVDVVANDSPGLIRHPLGIVIRGGVGVETGCALQDIRVIKLGGFTVFGIRVGQRFLALRRRARCTKRRNFDDFPSKEDVREAEPAADEPTVAELSLDLFG